jgi:hypothetical protein
MISLLETLIIVAILSLNFATMFRFRSPISLIISTIFTSLAIIFLCVINIYDPQILKSLIITILIYSSVIIALISSANIEQENIPISKNKLRCGLILICVLAISWGVFYVGKNINDNFVSKNDNKLERIMGIVDSVRIVEENTGKRNLENNVFLKNSTDAVLLIVGLMMVVLLAGRSRK